jgi:hypothetical protein
MSKPIDKGPWRNRKRVTELHNFFRILFHRTSQKEKHDHAISESQLFRVRSTKWLRMASGKLLSSRVRRNWMRQIQVPAHRIHRLGKRACNSTDGIAARYVVKIFLVDRRPIGWWVRSFVC